MRRGFGIGLCRMCGDFFLFYLSATLGGSLCFALASAVCFFAGIRVMLLVR
jgi:hypothetical protein